jgi:hypothetical protein
MNAPLPDHDNHHNALLCPYCNPERLVLARPGEVEVLRAKLEASDASVQIAVKLLSGIHALLYPAPLTLANGSQAVFRPGNPHEFMQELSDRIRALPDEMAKAGLLK